MLLKNCALVIKKIGKWSEMSISTIPLEVSVFEKLFVRMWSIRVASVLVILVGFIFFSVFQSLRKVPEGSLEVELEATVELHLNV